MYSDLVVVLVQKRFFIANGIGTLGDFNFVCFGLVCLMVFQNI